MAFLRVLTTVFGVIGYALSGLLRSLAAIVRVLGRGVRGARNRGGAGESGMIRLLDLHAASIAGDALIAIGLAGTIFFAVPAGEARGRVALYLLVTMLPFSVLAPVVGPVLDRFRHGRRYALATTFLGRGFLALLISEHLDGLALYPAAFGILVLSRAYGVARSAAVPRLLPARLGLSEANARASVFGTIAAALAAPVGIAAAAAFGQPWPLRIAILIFGYGMVTALRLPPRADSEPAETVPRILQRPGHKGVKLLSAPIIVATIGGSAILRALYGFLTLYLAFAIRSGDLSLTVPGRRLTEPAALGLIVAALGVGSFLATAVGTTMRIHRPTAVQAVAILFATAAAGVAAWWFTLPWVALLCLVAAMGSGLAKLTVDAVIQEHTDDQHRASAFAHAETMLMVAWVAGAGLGLVRLGGQWGLVAVTVALVAGTGYALWSAVRLRRERLRGTPRAAEKIRADKQQADNRRATPDRTEPTTVDPVRVTTADDERTTVSLGTPAPAPAEPPAQRTPAQARTKVLPAAAPVSPAPTSPIDLADSDEESPGFHLYRPSSRRDEP